MGRHGDTHDCIVAAHTVLHSCVGKPEGVAANPITEGGGGQQAGDDSARIGFRTSMTAFAVWAYAIKLVLMAFMF